MAGTVIFEEQVEIPLDVGSLADFRRWAHSESFPQRGRIDYIGGRIEVDMSPEDFYSHGTLKTEIIGTLHQRLKRTRHGELVTDSTRISSIEADLSAEPDIVFVSHEALSTGRTRLVPKATGEEGCYIELEGAPDLIVEIVSDNSTAKDTRRLPPAYYAAGVAEFWLVDARGKELLFQIHSRGEAGFEAVRPDEDGFQQSSVFACGYRLDRQWQDRPPRWEYDLLENE